jgi:hypothetical protein
MNVSEILLDGFGRLPELVAGVLDGADAALLDARIDPEANSIAWLIWHFTRVEDNHIADVKGTGELWDTAGWSAKFALPAAVAGTIGYGHTTEQVGQVHASADLLRGYHQAVHETTIAYLSGLKDADYDRIVDTRWNPPVTLGVRLMSVLCEVHEHVAQAAYVRGVVERTRG